MKKLRMSLSIPRELYNDLNKAYEKIDIINKKYYSYKNINSMSEFISIALRNEIERIRY